MVIDFFFLFIPPLLFSPPVSNFFSFFFWVLNVHRKELLPCGLIYNTGGGNIRLDETKCGRRSPSSSIHSVLL